MSSPPTSFAMHLVVSLPLLSSSRIIISLLSLSCRRNNLKSEPRLLVLLSAKKRVYYSALQVRASLLLLQSIVNASHEGSGSGTYE